MRVRLYRPSRYTVLSICILPLLAIGSCQSTIDVRFSHDPGGGLLTSFEACLYDFDADGFWYVIFLRQDDLGICNHRHEAGHHLMLRRNGDIVFYSRCSGRGEAIDIMGKTFSLKNGQVFLVSQSTGGTQIVQLPAQSKRFDGTEPSARATALAALLDEPWVQAFVSDDARYRIKADQAEQQKTKAAPAK